MKLFGLLLIVLLMCSIPSFAQDEPASPPTNFDEYIAQHDGYVQIEDFPLPPLDLQISMATTHIRKVNTEGETRLYYQVESGRYYGSVESDDFPALIKAFARLKAQSHDEKRNTHVYFENKYIDRGGLEFGYIVERKKLTWFIKPHRFGHRVLYVKDASTIEVSFAEGAKMIQKVN